MPVFSSTSGEIPNPAESSYFLNHSNSIHTRHQKASSLFFTWTLAGEKLLSGCRERGQRMGTRKVGSERLHVPGTRRTTPPVCSPVPVEETCCSGLGEPKALLGTAAGPRSSNSALVSVSPVLCVSTISEAATPKHMFSSSLLSHDSSSCVSHLGVSPPKCECCEG